MTHRCCGCFRFYIFIFLNDQPPIFFSSLSFWFLFNLIGYCEEHALCDWWRKGLTKAGQPGEIWPSTAADRELGGTWWRHNIARRCHRSSDCGCPAAAAAPVPIETGTTCRPSVPCQSAANNQTNQTVVRAFDSWSRGRESDSRPVHYRVT